MRGLSGAAASPSREVYSLSSSVQSGTGSRAERALAVGADQVIGDRAGLAEAQVAVVDHRRLAERVDRLELGRGQPGQVVAHVELDVVAGAEFLAEPQDALRARIVEVVDGDHRRGSPLAIACARL